MNALANNIEQLKNIPEESQKITREDVIQYCLNQGTGIKYCSSEGETTAKELEDSHEKHENPRYVQSDLVDFFCNEIQNGNKVAYEAISANMDLLDFDEWVALNNAIGVQLSRGDAFKINQILWGNYDFSPLDCEPLRNAKSVKEAISLNDLSAADEQTICDILKNYADCALTHTERKSSLADNIEQFMFDRGEYDFGESDRARWLENIPNAYELADDYISLAEARDKVTKNIANALESSEGRTALEGYLKDQTCEMDEEDELVEFAEDLMTAIKSETAARQEYASYMQWFESERTNLFAEYENDPIAENMTFAKYAETTDNSDLIEPLAFEEWKASNWFSARYEDI